MNNTNISVVIPCYNEEKNIPTLYKRLKIILNKISKRHEIIFIDDGSIDKSLSKIKILRQKDKKVKFAAFSRNFGHMSALSAGLGYAQGDKVILMDADLQDPPEAILKMWRKSKLGYDVVYGIKKKRKEILFKRLLFKGFYSIFNNISKYKMPVDSGTFSLLDNKIIKILKDLPEKNKYLSGLRSWTGFQQTGVVYERGRRTRGKASSLTNLLKLASNAIFSFSYLPLRISSIIGIFCAMISIVGIIIVLILKIFFNWGLIGWASTLITILLFSSVQLITLGIIGEYLARIYDEVKDRPEYIIKEISGLK